MSPKKIGKRLLCRLLESQVKRLVSKTGLKVVAVSGSVGKTSTKLAIARTLSVSHQVIFEAGNYNDRLTVPLVIFNRTEPAIYNILAWFKILLKNELTLSRPFAYDIAVVELGTDQPGQLKDFAYLNPDICVITAVAVEHMEQFGSLDKVAAEELTPLTYAKSTLVNADNLDLDYLGDSPCLSYGSAVATDYRLVERQESGLDGQSLTIGLINKGDLNVQAKVLGAQGALALVAAAAVADQFKMKAGDIKRGLDSWQAFAGRMQVLAGLNGSTLIDDTYNASPVAMTAALDVLYSAPAKQRIAILGSMNELGSVSEAEHRAVGGYCDPRKLNLVVTIGQAAEAYLAPAARAVGCQVESYQSPYLAGQAVRRLLETGTVVLAKGSQNMVFAEEALKLLLAEPVDSSKLVRQSHYWLNLKKKQFKEERL